MVNCYLCKQPIKVTTEKHYYDEKLKKRYHMRCFAGICRVCDKPVNKKTKHKTVGANVWHTDCYERRERRKNPKKGFKSWLQTLEGDLGQLEETVSSGDLGQAMEQVRGLEYAFDKMQLLVGKGEKQLNFWLDTFEGDLSQLQETISEGDVSGILGQIGGLKYSLAKMRAGKPKKNPGRPPREFWGKVYPDVHAGYKKKYPGQPKKAERLARETTGSIWHHKMSPKRKAEYERVRRKRENPASAVERFLSTGHPRGSAPEENPMLVTPEQELELRDAYRRLQSGYGTREDRKLVEKAQRAGGVFLSTGPSIMLKKAPPLSLASVRANPGPKKAYIIRDLFGNEFDRGTATPEEAEAKAVTLGRKHMREMQVQYQ